MLPHVDRDAVTQSCDRVRWPRPPAWDLVGPSGPVIGLLESGGRAIGMGFCRPVRACHSVDGHLMLDRQHVGFATLPLPADASECF